MQQLTNMLTKLLNKTTMEIICACSTLENFIIIYDIRDGLIFSTIIIKKSLKKSVNKILT